MTSSQPEHTTQTTKVELPKWVDKASLANYRMAKRIGTKPYKPYKGDMVADLDPMYDDAFSQLQGSNATTAGRFNSAADMFNRAANFDVQSRDVVAGQLKDTDLNPYLNPYIDNVEKKSLAALDDTRMQALMGNADKAASANAFGSSRHGIVDAVTNAQSAKDAGLLSAQLRSSGFENAQNAALSDIGNKYAADVSNRDSDMNAQLAELAALQNSGAGLTSLAGAESDANMKNFAAMLQSAGIKTAQQQAELDARRQKFDERQNYDTDKLNLRLSALGMSPYGKTENVERTTQPASAGTDWAQAGLGIFSLLLGLSEDDTKTDKEKVGKVPGTDLDLWAYRYKKDPKDRPKVVGIMASDVEKKIPSAVIKVGGKRIVDYTEILRAL